jgi:hypothetical protein
LTCKECECNQADQPPIGGWKVVRNLGGGSLNPLLRRSTLGTRFTFNSNKINEKYIKQAKETADRMGGGSAFHTSRTSGDDGKARLDMDSLRSGELRTQQEINDGLIRSSPNVVIKEGSEHYTFIPDNKDYVIKVTKPSETGTSGVRRDGNGI